jgi:uncharacterized phage-associated protein
MAQVSAHDIAAELRHRRPRIDDVTLHKLLYFAQGFHLATTGRPLFNERVEAWARGPVVGDLWRDEHHHQSMPPRVPLDDGQRSVVDYVLARFGSMSPAELIHLTHTDGGPWCQVTETDASPPFGNEEIGTKLMMKWFKADDEMVGRSVEAERMGRRWRELISAESSPGLAASLERATTGECFLKSPAT